MKSLVETIKYARTHKLKPGINIPKKKPGKKNSSKTLPRKKGSGLEFLT